MSKRRADEGTPSYSDVERRSIDSPECHHGHALMNPNPCPACEAERAVAVVSEDPNLINGPCVREMGEDAPFEIPGLKIVTPAEKIMLETGAPLSGSNGVRPDCKAERDPDDANRARCLPCNMSWDMRKGPPEAWPECANFMKRRVPRYVAPERPNTGALPPRPVGKAPELATPYGKKNVVLPTDAKARKNAPMARGVLDYFPRALAAVAELSRIGNEQHNPGQPMHWAKHKSTDHADCIVRHEVDRGTIDTDKVRHSTKVCWRSLAQLEIELQAEEGDPEAIRQVMENGTEAHKARLRELELIP